MLKYLQYFVFTIDGWFGWCHGVDPMKISPDLSRQFLQNRVSFKTKSWFLSQVKRGLLFPRPWFPKEGYPISPTCNTLEQEAWFYTKYFLEEEHNKNNNPRIPKLRDHHKLFHLNLNRGPSHHATYFLTCQCIHWKTLEGRDLFFNPKKKHFSFEFDQLLSHQTLKYMIFMIHDIYINTLLQQLEIQLKKKAREQLEKEKGQALEPSTSYWNLNFLGLAQGLLFRPSRSTKVEGSCHQNANDHLNIWCLFKAFFIGQQQLNLFNLSRDQETHENC